MFEITDLTDRGLAFHEHAPHLAGGQPDLGVIAFLGHQLSKGTGGPDELCTSPDPEFHVMDQGAQGDVFEWNRIARLDIRPLAADNLIAHVQF